MTTATQQLLQEALGLRPVERAELIEKLFRSFDRTGDQRVDTAWAEETESRIDAYEAGQIPADSAEAVLARINERESTSPSASLSGARGKGRLLRCRHERSRSARAALVLMRNHGGSLVTLHQGTFWFGRGSTPRARIRFTRTER